LDKLLNKTTILSPLGNLPVGKVGMLKAEGSTYI